MNKELEEKIDNLTESINSLTAIQQDIFKTDTSFDDLASTRGKIQELLDSNEELRKSIISLTVAINSLAGDIKKR